MQTAVHDPAGHQASMDEALIRRVWWRIMPLILMTYLVSVIDKMNVSFAKLQMVHDIGLTETAYGLASSLFFIGYLVFEVPSALAVHRYGAPRWFFRIVISWGIATMLLAYISTGSTFAALRLLVGAAEAGLYPGIIYYMTLWFPRRYQVRALAMLTLGSALGNMLGSAFGGLLLSLDGVGNHTGWQWVFLVTGFLAIALAPVVLLRLPRSIDTASFLAPEERIRLADLIAAEAPPAPQHEGSVWAALWNRKVLAFAVGYTLLLTSLYGLIYWVPTVIKGFGVSNTMNGVLTMVPWGLTALLLMVVPRQLTNESRVRVAAVVIGVIGAAALVASMLVTDPVARYVALVIGTPCTSLLLPCFWSLPSKYFNGRGMAASLAAISSVGNLGGFVAQNAMPWIGKTLGEPGRAMLLPAICLLLVGVIALMLHMKSARMPPLALAS